MMKANDYIGLIVYGVVLYTLCQFQADSSYKETFIHTCSTYFNDGIADGMCKPIPGTEMLEVKSGADWDKCCGSSDEVSPTPITKSPQAAAAAESKECPSCDCVVCPQERKWLQWIGVITLTCIGTYIIYKTIHFIRMQTKEGRSARYTYNSTQPGGWWKGKAEKTRVNNANAGTRLIKKGNDLGESTSALSPEQIAPLGR
jgi:hypothetical protein